jgi:hypothetical protein
MACDIVELLKNSKMRSIETRRVSCRTCSTSIRVIENPAIRQGTITKNETKYLSTGEEYKLSVLPTEVVTINITSLDENDVEITTWQYGKEKKLYAKGNK